MKRKIITLGIVNSKLFKIEAKCNRCMYWDRCEYGSYKGHCHRYPEDHVTDEVSWCGEFSPEETLGNNNETP